MIAIPAVDLREGACVQLVGGSYADERVRIADPLEAVRRWATAGFTRLHVVDLDAATGKGSNAAVIDRIMGETSLEVQVGGGVRTTERVRALLDAGATRVVVGTRAVEDAPWLAEICAAFPDRVIIAADVKDRNVVTHGWATASPRDVAAFVEGVATLPLAGILVTAVHLEGRMAGTDVGLMGEIADLASVPVIASGGIASIGELRALGERGVAAAVLGMSLYTNALDPRAVAMEFGS
jgi:phosphoribosylformimino-5-aminoimidazole carboxamide ribotide isomerase